MADDEVDDGGVDSPTLAKKLLRYADIIGLSVVMIGLLMPVILGDGRDKPPKLQVVELDQSFYKTVLYPEKTEWDQGGPNGPEVSWAVFFHKPYCGACRRIRPVFNALATLTNSSEHLRFASVDCVKYRAFCQREEIDREPYIRIYSTIQSTIKSTNENRNKISFVRKGVRDWKGLLVAYEVVSWFRTLQQDGGPLARKYIAWPNEDDLAKSISEFKQSSKHVGNKLDPTISSRSLSLYSPDDYLVDIESALSLGLHDDIFGPGTTILEGKRLETLINWIETLSHVFPKKDIRVKLAQLRQALNGRVQWRKPIYMELMKEFDIQEPSPLGTTIDGVPSKHYRWCRSNSPGEGGYPCGLWLLFHSMLANTDSQRAHLTLRIIYEWVQSFYGCVECAINFQSEWEEEDGFEQYGHIQASTWLWKVHNMVRARLTEDDDSIEPKHQWPSIKECYQCYTNQTRLHIFGIEDEKQLKSLTNFNKEKINNHISYHEHYWNTEYVFSFLQETFCIGSDTFVCEGFIDES